MKNLALIVTLIVFFSACKKGDSTNAENNNNNEEETTTSPWYFTAKINGSNVKFEADDLMSTYQSGAYNNENSLGWEDFDIYEGTHMLNITSPDTNAIFVSILKYFNHEPSLDERWAIITSGTHGFGLSNSSSATINGASIGYIDGNGKEWNSELGDQTGSTFNVTELVENDESLYGMIWKAVFSCKLYDEDGNSITVTDATIKGRLYGN